MEQQMRNFLTEFCNSELSPSGDGIQFAIGCYSLNPEEVFGEVANCVLYYLEQKKCPCELSIAVANAVAAKLSKSASENATQTCDNDERSWQDLSTLYKEIIQEIHSVCNLLLEQPKGVENVANSVSKRFATSSFAIRNKRRKMEDRHVVIHDLNGLLDLKDMPPQSYYAVFDGHAGIEAACYAASQLHINLVRHPDFISNTSNAIDEAYKITDDRIVEKSQNQNCKSGCTAVSALIRGTTIFLTWLGDSQALLVKQGKPVPLMNPHKPERPDERKRVEDLGGEVIFFGTWRVNGNLAVSRALGDPDHKPYVISKPDTNIIELDGTEDFLILACDGLWDEVTAEQVAATLYQYLNDSSISDPVDTIAAKLVHQSKLQGSDDNITTIVIFLRDIQNIREDSSKFLSLFASVDRNDTYELTDSVDNENSVVKPNLLELNGASAKKVNNVDDLLNLSYSSTTMQNVDGFGAQMSDFNLASSNSSASEKYFSDCKTSIGILPEATALSELPTPPIDDVLVLQKFGQVCATDLYQGLDQVTADLNLLNIEAKSSPAKNSHLESSKESSAMEEMEIDSTVVEDLQATIVNYDVHQTETKSLSEDAIGIASTVVTHAIETAVKHVSSSEIDSSVKPVQKLNPYAEPFVMKSFFTQQESLEENVALKDSGEERPISVSAPTSNSVEQITKTNENESHPSHNEHSQINVSHLSEVENLVQETSNLLNLSEAPISVQESELIQTVPFETNDLQAAYPEVPDIDETKTIKESNLDTELLLEKNLLSETNEGAAQQDKSNLLQSVTLCSEIDQNAVTQDDVNLLHPIPPHVQMNDSVTHDDSNLLHPEVSYSAITVSGNSNLLHSEASHSELNESSNSNLLCSGASFSENNESISSNLLHSDVSHCDNNESVHSNVLQPEISFSDQENLNFTHSAISHSDINESGNSNLLHSEISQLAVNEAVTLSNIISEHNLDNVPSSETAITIQNEAASHGDALIPEPNAQARLHDISTHVEKPEVCNNLPKENSEISDMCILKPVLKGVEEELLKTAKSELSENPEDMPCNVYLQSVPDGIPEAEGVTEDIDSDSEKDGGWSYMKAPNVTSDKSATGVKPTTAAKTEKKSVGKSSSSQSLKSASDFKTKVKTLPLEKAAKNALDKMTSDTKDGREKIKIRGTTIPVTKVITEKPKTTASRVKKDTALPGAKPIAYVAPSRPRTLQRNPVTSTKAGTSVTTTVSRPKSAVTSTEAKVTQRPLSTLTKTTASSLVRNISSRSATAGASTKSAPTARAPPLLSKSASTEVKSRPVSAVAKRPASTVPKKPDIKETKNNVNKQISAGKLDPLAPKPRKLLTSTPRPNIPSSRIISRNEQVPSLRVSAKPADKAEMDKKDAAKRSTFSVRETKSTASSRITKDLKSRSTRTTNVSGDRNEKRGGLIAAKKSDIKASQNANLSEQEKFILETNIKETVSDEQKTPSVEAKNELCAASQDHVAEASVKNSVSENASKTDSALPNVM